MLFCPRLLLRKHKDDGYYCGCLSGLGMDQQQAESLFPDHDMEIVFEVRIDKNDIEQVNFALKWYCKET